MNVAHLVCSSMICAVTRILSKTLWDTTLSVQWVGPIARRLLQEMLFLVAHLWHLLRHCLPLYYTIVPMLECPFQAGGMHPTDCNRWQNPFLCEKENCPVLGRRESYTMHCFSWSRPG